jgi:2-iminoacetate synthase ThiH
MNFPHLQESLDRVMSMVNPVIGDILDRALSGADISAKEATRLFEADGADLPAMILAANHLRAETVGDVVTYVINRNINFTNVCVKACGFCAFSRGHLAEEGYFLPVEEIIRRGQEARELGATEITT